MCLIQKDREDTGAANQGQDKGGAQGDMAQEAEETLKKQNKTQSSRGKGRQDRKSLQASPSCRLNKVGCRIGNNYD